MEDVFCPLLQALDDVDSGRVVFESAGLRRERMKEFSTTSVHLLYSTILLEVKPDPPTKPKEDIPYTIINVKYMYYQPGYPTSHVVLAAADNIPAFHLQIPESV